MFIFRLNASEELRSYQDLVAGVYGSYERIEFQKATISKLYHAIPYGERTLISLGSGPSSYELWLLSQNRIKSVVLVDISQYMLDRAVLIAEQLGVRDRVEIICSDISSVVLPQEQADICVSINSLHWDQEWRTWIKKAIACTKPEGTIFLSASMLFTQSVIAVDQFAGVAARGITIREQGYLIPGEIVGANVAQTTRYYITGRKKTAKELKAKKR